ncbi:MAG: thioesterase [Alphaproteobacteria bacterium]|nr:thioesterase [Alphaproteobacteria bacterium]
MKAEISKYKKEYHVKSYETDCHGFLRVVTLMNWLQDIAFENAEFLGFGLEACRAQNLAWVGSDYAVRIRRMPRLDEHITIETWPATEKLWGAIRDFTLKDKNGEIIALASSQWVLIDYERRRPVALKKHFPNYSFIPERVIAEDFPKINPPQSHNVYDFEVRFDDVDVNNHVNNAVYPLWASESLDNNYRKEHFISEMNISFKKEALYGETVSIHTTHEQDESLHLITDKNTGTTLAACRFKWTKITL